MDLILNWKWRLECQLLNEQDQRSIDETAKIEISNK